jgi:hypothetical protein
MRPQWLTNRYLLEMDSCGSMWLISWRSTNHGMNRLRKEILKTLNFTLVMFVVAALVGCGGLTKSKAVAENAIAQFHTAYNEGKLDDIWKDADQKFRAASTRQKYDDFLGAVQRKLGKVNSTSNAAWNVQSFNLKTSVFMTQKTIFEHGQGTELFTFALDGTNAALVGYNIQSMDLITK